MQHSKLRCHRRKGSFTTDAVEATRACMSAFAPKADKRADVLGRPLCAKTGLMQCNTTTAYSITSSARASSVGGSVTPSALAVLRLTESRKLVGRNTGKFAGFEPFRMYPV